ncbi:hypothetical protein [Amycolatopsis tolypomycina]|uniref:hypothetical protein n=1 Tax=Amycolatopsis tolypomycina TaxID=208445 RepID=UPI0033A800F8
MDFTKIAVAAFESGAIGHAVWLTVAAFFYRVVRQALEPAVIREFSRRRVVKQIQKSAGSKFTPAQLEALRTLLENKDDQDRFENKRPPGEP